MGSIIQSVGLYSPPRVLTNSDLEKILALSGQETSDQWIVQRTGIHKRNVAGVDETVGSMAVKVTQDALSRSDLDIPPIEHVIFATNTNDQPFPNVAGYVCAEVHGSNPSKILEGASGIDLYGGCGGINFALMNADSLIRSGQFETVLVIGAEKLSGVTDYSDRQTCILFGDGASAYLLTRNPQDLEFGFMGHFPMGDGTKRGLIECVSSEKVTLDDALSALERNASPIRTSGKVLKMDGRRVFTYVTGIWKDLLNGLEVNSKLNPKGLKFDDLFGIAGYLANLRCFENIDREFPKFLKKCGLTDPLDIKNFFFNTSTASQGRRVRQLLDAAPQGDYILMFGYGAGLEACANLYRKH